MRPNTCELRRGFSGEMDVERFVAVSCLRQCNLASLCLWWGGSRLGVGLHKRYFERGRLLLVVCMRGGLATRSLAFADYLS